jgi:hypothetical protein
MHFVDRQLVIEGTASESKAEALIREARRRGRGRRSIWLAVIVLVAGGGIAIGYRASGSGREHVSGVGQGSGQPVGAATFKPGVATLNLSRGDKYSEITVVGGRILLYGSTSKSAVTVANTCFSASVDPETLALSDERSGNCANPVLQGHQVLPVFAIDKNLPSPSGGPTAVVRIAHVALQRPGYALGPVVMTFPALAPGDSKPTWIYGGGDLWLYEWDNPGGIDLMRISATTGDVLQRIRVPHVWHAILAYNNDGLWIAPSGQTAGPPHVLYRVAPGGTKATAVFHFARDGFAGWIVGSGDDLWVGARSYPVPGVVWMLRGPQGTPGWHVRETSKIDQVFETLGDSGMVGNESDGLWAAPPTRYNRQRVVRIDPISGEVSTEATLKAKYLVVGPAKHLVVGPNNYLYLSPLTSWRGVTFAGSFFVLDPPAPVPGTSNKLGGFSALYRITPKSLR